MKKAPKILGSIRKKHKGPLYSFKLGSNIKDNELLKKANVLLKNSDCVIANYSDAMGSESSKAAIVDKKNTNWITGTKNNLSRIVLEKIATELTQTLYFIKTLKLILKSALRAVSSGTCSIMPLLCKASIM